MSDRSPTTDALDTLGTIITVNEKRDAIHLAVEPVIAGEDLEPGMHVRLVGGKAYVTKVGKGVGIVDPFLEEGPYEGQMFWLVVYPRQIKSLRHVWEHPSFPKSSQTVNNTSPTQNLEAIKDAKKAITIIAESIEATYDELMRAAHDYYDNDEMWNEGERFEAIDNSIPDEFWAHYSTVTGKPYKDLGHFLSCSC